MNRRGLFRFLTGAAAAVGLGNVPGVRKRLISSFPIWMDPAPTSDRQVIQVYSDEGTVWGDVLRNTQRQINEAHNAIADHFARQPQPSFMNFRSVKSHGGRRDSDPDCRSWRGKTTRQRVLNALDASRDARLTSRFDEGA